MKIDNIDYFSSEKLQKVIEQRFGQSININDLSDSTLDLFQESVQDSVDKFEHSVGYTKLSTNPTYMENKILLDYITKEQEKRMKVSKVMGKEVELTDPNNPGVKTTIDTSKVDVDKDQTGKLKIDKKQPMTQKPKLSLGQQISMEAMDDDVEQFIDYLSNKGYKILSQGGSANSVSIEYQDREGNTHTVDFKRGGVSEDEHETPKDDLEDIVAPEFKKVVHDMQQGMSKEEIKKKYPKSAKMVDQVADDIKKVMEVMKNHFLTVQGHQVDEAGYQMSGKETAALRLLVGSQN